MTADIKPVAFFCTDEDGETFFMSGTFHPDDDVRSATPLYTREQLDAAVSDALERALMSTDSTRLSDVGKSEQ